MGEEKEESDSNKNSWLSPRISKIQKIKNYNIGPLSGRQEIACFDKEDKNECKNMSKIYLK